MGKRYAWLFTGLALLGVVACGNTGGDAVAGPTPTAVATTVAPEPKKIDGMDSACQALSAQEINTAMGVSDIKLIRDEPRTVRGTTQIVPGRQCFYANRLDDMNYPRGTDVHGLSITVSQFDASSWKRSTADTEYLTKVDIGDEAYLSKIMPILTIRHGAWVIAVLGVDSAAVINFDLIVRATQAMGKLVVDRLPSK